LPRTVRIDIGGSLTPPPYPECTASGDDMVNFYLVEDGPELLLVDAGLLRHFAQLTRLLERLGRSLSGYRRTRAP
jgi:hypothetical protein